VVNNRYRSDRPRRSADCDVILALFHSVVALAWVLCHAGSVILDLAMVRVTYFEAASLWMVSLFIQIVLALVRSSAS